MIFHIAEDIDALDMFIDDTAAVIAKKSHLALRSAKKLVQDNQDADIATVLDREMEGMTVTGQSDECIKRITAFLKK